jgi:DNA-binding transcriptional LysR family regulator
LGLEYRTEYEYYDNWMLGAGSQDQIGRRLVAPLTTEFRRNFPDVQVHLVLSDAGLDVIDDGLDVALRVGLPSDSSVIARKVLTAKAITCASPSYFKEHGTPAKPGDLLQHDCIRLVRGRRVMDAWVFQEQGKAQPVLLPRPTQLTRMHTALLNELGVRS